MDPALVSCFQSLIGSIENYLNFITDHESQALYCQGEWKFMDPMKACWRLDSH